jgi:hypothetical protein
MVTDTSEAAIFFADGTLSARIGVVFRAERRDATAAWAAAARGETLRDATFLLIFADALDERLLFTKRLFMEQLIASEDAADQRLSVATNSLKTQSS